jgi:hypothetical protein
MRRLLAVLLPIVGLLLMVQLPAGGATGQPRATLTDDEMTAQVPTLTAEVDAATATAVAGATQTAGVTYGTQTAQAGPVTTPTCAPGPQCVYLSNVLRFQLPTATPIPPTPLPPTAVPAPNVYILSNWRAFTRSGYQYVVGEVRNDTGDVAHFVRVNARYYDASGVLIDTDFTYTYVDELIPGQKSPFKIVTIDPPPGIARVEVDGTWVRASNPDNRTLAVISATQRQVNGRTEIVGEVQNNSGSPLQFVQVIATFYAPDGTVYDADFTYAEPSTVAPGQTAAYEISPFVDLSGTTYAVQAEGDIP